MQAEGRLGRFTAYGRTTGTKRRGPVPAYRRQTRVKTLARNLMSSHAEKKTVDFNVSTSITSAGSFLCHNALTTGSDMYQRNGRRVINKSLQLDFWLNPHAAITNPTVEMIRVITFYDKQSNGANPSVADLLSSTNYVGAVTSNASAFLNPSYYERFIVLRDDRITLPQTTGGFGANVLSGTTQTHFKHYIKLNNLISHYEVTGGGDEPSTGAIWTVVLGIQASAQYDLFMNSRLRFTDA